MPNRDRVPPVLSSRFIGLVSYPSLVVLGMNERIFRIPCPSLHVRDVRIVGDFRIRGAKIGDGQAMYVAISREAGEVA